VPRVSDAGSTELAPGVTALTQLVDLAQPLSWVEAGARGFDPSNCYLIRSGAVATLIDTGVAANGGSLLDRLRRLIPPDTALTVTLTRVEPDCLGNLLALARAFKVVRVCSQSNVIPFDYIGPYSAEFPGVDIVNGLHPGDTVPVDGDRSLVVVEPAVRTLPTLWYFDEQSGTLFTSDFFGEDRPGSAKKLSGGAVGVEAARRHVLAKFDWLSVADTSAALGRLDRVFETLPVKAIAPGHGLWVRGEDAVRERYGVVREAIRTAGAES
jgi:flavorubredoxin